MYVTLGGLIVQTPFPGIANIGERGRSVGEGQTFRHNFCLIDKESDLRELSTSQISQHKHIHVLDISKV